jgi:hypothetical protein
MYYIQGADQKEYGPVSSDQLRQWISENRLNRFSPARAEGDSLWKTLGDFPEFAEALGGSAMPQHAPPPPPTPGVSPQANPVYGSGFRPATPGISESIVDSKLKAPAIGILVTGVLGTGISLYGVLAGLAGSGNKTEIPPGMPPEAERFLKTYVSTLEAFSVPLNLLALILGVLTLLAGIKMLQRRSYGLVMTGVILGMLPCLSPCCCTGLPFGIWALVVLSNPEVRNSFR